MTPQEKLELLLDTIAEALIVSEYVDTTKVNNSQKFIRNGQLQQGSGAGVLALFQKDIKANEEDLVNSATVIVDESNVQQYFAPITLHRLNIQLWAVNNVLYDSNNSDASYEFEITMVKNKKLLT